MVFMAAATTCGRLSSYAVSGVGLATWPTIRREAHGMGVSMYRA